MAGTQITPQAARTLAPVLASMWKPGASSPLSLRDATTAPQAAPAPEQSKTTEYVIIGGAVLLGIGAAVYFSKGRGTGRRRRRR